MISSSAASPRSASRGARIRRYLLRPGGSARPGRGVRPGRVPPGNTRESQGAVNLPDRRLDDLADRPVHAGNERHDLAGHLDLDGLGGASEIAGGRLQQIAGSCRPGEVQGGAWPRPGPGVLRSRRVRSLAGRGQGRLPGEVPERRLDDGHDRQQEHREHDDVAQRQRTCLGVIPAAEGPAHAQGSFAACLLIEVRISAPTAAAAPATATAITIHSRLSAPDSGWPSRAARGARSCGPGRTDSWPVATSRSSGSLPFGRGTGLSRHKRAVNDREHQQQQEPGRRAARWG